MSYKKQLNPWCIVCTLPDKQFRFIARFRRRNEAEGRLQVLKANNPSAPYAIIFDTIAEHSDVPAKQELSDSEPTVE